MNCCNLKINTANLNNCPICNYPGEKVDATTIECLLLEHKVLKTDKTYCLCLNSNCNVAYFNNTNDYILKSELKVPIWFKDGAVPKYLCYCSNVTEDEIIEAIINKGCKTVKDVVANTNAMKIQNCKVNSLLVNVAVDKLMIYLKRLMSNLKNGLSIYTISFKVN